ncbi:hypothetical protein TNCV_4820091 [Trichonephila clavipes]|nr:hypothetical protein TNCV_4820091 [Trichonephila clavipes]
MVYAKLTRKKKPKLWDELSLVLLHDNAPATNPSSSLTFLRKRKKLFCLILLTPLISPCDFSLFPELAHRLTGRRFFLQMK